VKKKSILFVGDSILYQVYLALYFQLGDKAIDYSIKRLQYLISGENGGILDQHTLMKGSQINVNDLYTGIICGGISHAYFMRNDHLTVERERSKFVRMKSNVVLDSEWKSAISKIDYLVLSKGHHSILNEIDESKLRADNEKLIRYLKNNVTTDKTQIIFMTTSYGHPYCSKNSSVINITINSEKHYEDLVTQYINSMPKSIATKFGWDRYHVHDLELIKLFKQVKATILDIGPMSLLRPDGHRLFYLFLKKNYIQ